MYNGKKLVAMWSGGKDSTAAIEVAIRLGYEIDLIRHTTIMFDEETHADLPPVWNFINEKIKVLSERYNIPYEIVSAKHTFKELFLTGYKKEPDTIQGYPLADRRVRWCRNELKIKRLSGKDEVKIIGIAIDEAHRCEKDNPNIIYPLVEAGWTEQQCLDWCRENDLASPTYDESDKARSGCFFCHLQSYESLKQVRNYYPELWQKWLELDEEGQRLAKPGTIPYNYRNEDLWITDYDKRMELEEQGLIPTDNRFKWKLIKPEMQVRKKVLLLDYSYESIATLVAIRKLEWELDEVRTLSVMFDEETSGEHPEVQAYKDKVNAWIKKWFDLDVKVIYCEETYKNLMFKDFSRQPGRKHGYPHLGDRWCRQILKNNWLMIDYASWKESYYKPLPFGSKKKPKLDLRNIYPLLELEWTHEDCEYIVRDLGLEAPMEDDFCWFCPFVKMDRMKELRNNYPELWNKWIEVDKQLKAEWTGDLMTSPVRQKGRWWTSDFDKRFRAEEKGLVPSDKKFRWKMLDDIKEEDLD